MLSVNSDNMRFSKRFQYFALIICACLIVVQCASKKEAAQEAVLPNLQIGISFDSAKKLTENAGWICDTTTKSASGLTTLFFRKIRIRNINSSLGASMQFEKGILLHFELHENPYLTFSSPPTHTVTDYKQLVVAIETGYGTPSHVDTAIHSLPQERNRIDTSLFTTWIDSTKSKLYTVQYSTLHGDLSFVAM